MLAKKSINKKRLAVYILIMIIMFGGMGFFTYKNYTLYYKHGSASSGSDGKINNENIIGGQDNKVIQEQAPQPAKKPELKLLENPQYMSLEDNTIDLPIENYIGKKEPFNANAANSGEENK